MAEADSASDVEEVVVDLAEANQLFQAYLAKGKISFLERLEKMAMDDEEMGEDESIGIYHITYIIFIYIYIYIYIY
jgi:hypothetical protein